MVSESDNTFEYEVVAGADYAVEQAFSRIGVIFDGVEELEKAIERVLVDVAEWLSEDLGEYGRISCFKKLREYVCGIPFEKVNAEVVVVIKYGIHINSIEFDVDTDNANLKEEVEEVLLRFTGDRYWNMAVEADFYVLGAEILQDALYAYLYDELGAIDDFEADIGVSDDGRRYFGRAKFVYGGHKVWVTFKGELVVVVHDVFADLADLDEEEIRELESASKSGAYGVDREIFYVEALSEEDTDSSVGNNKKVELDICDEIRRLQAMGYLDKLWWISDEVVEVCLAGGLSDT